MICYIYLFIAILAEVFSTSLLKISEGFTKIFPSILIILGYIVSSFFLSLALKDIPIGIAYSSWSGFGIVFVTISGYFLYNQKINLIEIFGIILIITGVLIINIY
ncbi:emrE [Wigglesworthia glossinidia endosymbiont of Glossina brevipalpis]|uniref:EmrE protein n=1 Tax=Wigglesworthia glossinidia brevipalpis TaxID=36870 RepID=Q8D1X0_WIGBR|nr:emrE [Wigglesworthia glossinidia endosymbiont of Glossina brevipalpis]